MRSIISKETRVEILRSRDEVMNGNLIRKLTRQIRNESAKRD